MLSAGASRAGGPEHAAARLAVGAVDDVVGGERDALESPATSRAGRAGAPVDREAVAERGLRQRAGPLSLGGQRLVEDVADAAEEPLAALVVERAERAEGREARSVQRVVGVAATDPCDGVLIAEHGVQMAPVLAAEHEVGERRLAGLRSERRERSGVVGGQEPEPRPTLGAVLAHEERDVTERQAHEGPARPRLLRGSLEVDAPAVAEVEERASLRAEPEARGTSPGSTTPASGAPRRSSGLGVTVFRPEKPRTAAPLSVRPASSASRRSASARSSGSSGTLARARGPLAHHGHPPTTAQTAAVVPRGSRPG